MNVRTARYTSCGALTRRMSEDQDDWGGSGDEEDDWGSGSGGWSEDSDDSLNWFSRLFGFNEDAQSYKQTQQILVVDGNTITSKINNKSYKIGHFATEALGEQRARVMKNEKVQQLVGKTHGLVLKIEIGDVTKFHMKPSNRHATFQVRRLYHIHACATCPRAAIRMHIRVARPLKV